MQLRSYNIDIQHFVTHYSFMLSVICSNVTLEFCCVSFSMRIGRFAKLSFATNLANILASKVSLHTIAPYVHCDCGIVRIIALELQFT